MFKNIVTYFIAGFLVVAGLGIGGGYDIAQVLVGAVLLGVYFPLSLVSIATWWASTEQGAEEMGTVFGPRGPDIVTAFHRLYRQNRGLVLGVTVLTWGGCGVALALWVRSALPGAWSATPGLLLAFTAVASLCGAIAGPGMAVLGLWGTRDASSGGRKSA